MQSGMGGQSISDSSALSGADKHFVQTAMEGNMAEIQLAQLAQQESSNDQVKQFAQRMIDDHTKMQDQLTPITQQAGVTPPAELSAKHKATHKKLESMSGAAFDKAYVDDTVADHTKDDAEFKKEETAAQNPALRDAVTQSEPIIAEHLKMVKDLQSSMKSGSSM